MTGRLALTFLFLCSLSALGSAQVSHVWVADNGDGTYKNPIIHADYSDPDVVRVGREYYMTASSFNAIPGLPILHSRDLVNWTLIHHAIRALEPAGVFARPQHGGGVWAPAIRYHAGRFYIYYSDSDYGIFVTTAKDPAGEWSKPALVKAAKGWIDPCPLWDDDGRAYLVHAFAGSRAGIKSVLVVNRMSAEGERLLDDGVTIFDGHVTDPTVEGPKFYKLNGYYYVLAPAGGVATGWQLALRSKNIYGPYERKVVLAQGKTDVNGPHQGALVDAPTGEWWFIHFQDKGPYGRVVHLQPTNWKNGFPVIGRDTDGDGTGEPVSSYRKPGIATVTRIETPPDSDEFNAVSIGRQWQWHANQGPGWAFPYPAKGVLRMNAVPVPDGYRNLWDAPNLLLQKFPAESFAATVKVHLDMRTDGERFALVVMGLDYAYIAVTRVDGKLLISQMTAKNADTGTPEVETSTRPLANSDVYLRVIVEQGATCRFLVSYNGNDFMPIGSQFKAREGRWIGAKVGMFYSRTQKTNDAGTADVDWFRVE